MRNGSGERLGESGRREALLRLLYDTATDLTGIRDVEASLKAIVRRTRTLIGTDIAYISLNDYAAGESHIRVTDGAATTEFRSIRLPIGGGVLGAVATGTAPAQSSDYLNDGTKTHFPDSDAAVAAEGVKAIMGVPLWADGTVTGALMVADRHAHEFSSEDVGLLESMSAHAAVALENARLFTEMTRTLERLNALQQERLEDLRRLEALTTFDQSLMEALAADDILAALLERIEARLGCQVWALDASGGALAGGSPPRSTVSRGAREAVADSLKRRSSTRFLIDGRAHTAMAVSAGKQHLAALVVERELTQDETAALERSSLAVSAALLFDRTLEDAQYRLQRELTEELLDTRMPPTEAVRRRARRFGIDEDAGLLVHVVAVEERDRQRGVSLLRRSSRPESGIIAAYETHICVIEPCGSAPEPHDPTGAWILETLAANGIAATVGSSLAVLGAAALSDAYAEARAVLDAMLALSRRGQSANRYSLGTAGMLLGASGHRLADQLLHSQIGPLLEYDEQRGTALTHTAWVYLESGTAQVVAAERLHVHPNTLRQRLERIDSLLGAAWRSGGRALDVHVALQLWRLRVSSE